MGLLLQSKTTEYPSALAHKVMTALFKKYQPKDVISCVELRQQLNRVE